MDSKTVLGIDKVMGGPTPAQVVDRNIDVLQGVEMVKSWFSPKKVYDANPYAVATNRPGVGDWRAEVFNKLFSPEGVSGRLGAEIKRLEGIAISHSADQLGVFATDVLAKQFLNSVSRMKSSRSEKNLDEKLAGEHQVLADVLLKSLEKVGRESSVNVLAHCIDELPYENYSKEVFDISGLAGIEAVLISMRDPANEKAPESLFAEQFTKLLNDMSGRSPTIENILTRARAKYVKAGDNS